MSAEELQAVPRGDELAGADGRVPLGVQRDEELQAVPRGDEFLEINRVLLRHFHL